MFSTVSVLPNWSLAQWLYCHNWSRTVAALPQVEHSAVSVQPQVKLSTVSVLLQVDPTTVSVLPQVEHSTVQCNIWSPAHCLYCQKLRLAECLYCHFKLAKEVHLLASLMTTVRDTEHHFAYSVMAICSLL